MLYKPATIHVLYERNDVCFTRGAVKIMKKCLGAGAAAGALGRAGEIIIIRTRRSSCGVEVVNIKNKKLLRRTGRRPRL